MGLRDGGWVPTDLVTRLEFEHQMHPDEINNPEKTHKRMLRDALPYVTMELRDLALKDPDPRIRLQASSLILDRAMGKAGTTTGADEAPGETLFKELSDAMDKILATRDADY